MRRMGMTKEVKNDYRPRLHRTLYRAEGSLPLACPVPLLSIEDGQDGAARAYRGVCQRAGPAAAHVTCIASKGLEASPCGGVWCLVGET